MKFEKKNKTVNVGEPHLVSESSKHHISEMVLIFEDDFNMHVEDVSHLTQTEHDTALYEYVIKRMSDNWEIDLNYSKSLEKKIELLELKLQENE